MSKTRRTGLSGRLPSVSGTPPVPGLSETVTNLQVDRVGVTQ
jgi:hypothetical protein